MAAFDVNFTPAYAPKRAGVTTPSPAAGSRTQDALNNLRATQPVANRGSVFYSPTKQTYVIGGKEFSSRDEAGILGAAQQSDLNAEYDAPEGDYRPLDTQGFLQFVDKIANPDLGRRFTKNFESATAGMGQIAGAGMSFLGAEDAGQGLMDVSTRRMEELSPYNLGIEDIDGSASRGVVDWFAGVLGQFGPSVVESVAAAAIGAGAGAVAGGGANPLTAAGGAVAGLFGKSAVKQALLKAAQKRLAGEAIDASEEKLLREAASVYAAAAQKNPGFVQNVIYGNVPAEQFGGMAAKAGAQDILKRGRQQAITGGAAAFSTANSYAMGVSDVYREGIESGAPDRATAAALGIPYAALDLLPEFLLAGRIFGAVGKNGLLTDSMTTRAKAGELLKRGFKGGAVGAGLEGSTEAGQEALLLAANPLVDMDSPEGISRLLNSFAAGAAIGGPIGTLANLADNKEPANLLKPTQDPATPTQPAPSQPAPTQPGPSAPVAPGSPPAPYASPAPEPINAQPMGTAVGAARPVPYAEFTEEPAQIGQQPLAVGGPSNPILALQQQRGLPPPQRALAPPTRPTPVDPRAQMAAQQAMRQQLGPAPVEGADPFLENARTEWQGRQNMEAQNRLMEQQRAKAALRQDNVSKFKVGAKAGAKAQLKKQVETLADNTGPLTVESEKVTRSQSEGQITEVTLSNGNTFRIQRTQGRGGNTGWFDIDRNERFDDGYLGDNKAEALERLLSREQNNQPEPTPPKPTKAAPKKPLKTEASAKAAKTPKGEAVKTEKLSALKRGSPRTDGRSEAPAAASSREESPAPPPRPEAAKASGAGVRSKQAVADDRDLDDAIDEVDTGSVSGLSDVFYYAYPEKDEDIDPATTQRAKDYLERTTFSTAQQNYLDKFLKSKGKTPMAEVKAQKQTSMERQTTLEKLMSYLDELVRNPSILQDRVQRMLAIGKSAALYREASIVTPGGERAVQAAAFNGKTVGDYFEVDRSGREMKPRLKIEADVENDTYSLADATDANGGNFYRFDGTAAPGVASGRIRFIINNFLSGLYVKPKVHVYRNVQELKDRNRSLFNRANKARPAGDFETTNAVGYAFDGNVIIFTDYVRTEQQLRFVLAHEAIGHFGLRAVVPGAQLNSMLDSVYANDRRVRAYVDRMVETGQDKREAVEEFLADFAAELDTSLVQRIWAMIKNALNKLGVKLDDDMSRLVIGQARLYVRSGVGGFANARSLEQMMLDMQQDANEGRFAKVFDDQHLGEQFIHNATLAYGVSQPYADIRDFIKDRKKEWFTGKAGDLQRWASKSLELIQSLNNKATRSEGLQMVYQIFQQQSRRAKQLLSRYLQKLPETYRQGITDAHKEKAGKLLAYNALAKNAKLDEAAIDEIGALIKDGELNEAVFNKVAEMGRLTREDFINGFEFPDSTGGVQTFKLSDHGMTAEDLDPNGRVWKVFLEQRDAANHAAVDLLAANLNSALYERGESVKRIFELRTDKALDRSDREALEYLIGVFDKIRTEGATIDSGVLMPKVSSMERADEFLQLVTRAFDNEAVLRSWQGLPVDDSINEVPDSFRTEFKDLVPKLKQLHDKGYTETQRYVIQRQVRNIVLTEQSTRDAERLAKRTIMTGYVPFKRRGKEQVRVAAFDAETGERVRLSDSLRGVMPYFRDDSDVILKQYEGDLNGFFKDKTFKLEDIEGRPVQVVLKAERATARQNPDFEGAINMNEFVYMLQKFDINLTPQSRSDIIKAMTGQNSKARSNLMRAAAPGWDADVLRNVAEWLEMMAHTAAKREFRSRTDNIMDRNDLWRGDRAKLERLKKTYENETEPYRRNREKRAYERYAYMYRHMAPTGQTVEINGKSHATLGYGERYRDDAKELLHWYSDQTNIYDNPEDALSGELGSKIKTAVVFAQLGGTIASAAANTVSLLTHSMPYLANYNPETSFGGGFGEGKTVRAVWQALRDTKNFRLGDIGVLTELRQNGTWERYGLTKDELDFLIEQTESGPLQAVLPDALLGTARGKITAPWMQKAAQVWMGPFSYTEKLNRRVTALAAYRLEKQRASAELGLASDHQKVVDSATTFALKAIDDTQGEYAQFNRPKIGRGPITSLIFMYKMFPVLTVQMLRHLPMKGKLTVLALLLMMSGLKGMPFADDIMDLLDTLLQKLGIKIGSVEAELYEMFDAMLPGSGNVFMRGALDQWTGATISTRTGMGDLVPLTGVFKAGADPWREAEQFLGPMAGGLFGGINSIAALASMGVDAAGGRPSSTSLVEIARQSPIALARALGDTWVYADNGAVVNSQGRVVASDAGPLVMLWRTLGFYPADATKANDLVRVAKASRDYQLEVSKAFKDAYVKAALSGDKGGMKAIEDQVDEWNSDAKGTGLEIKTFRESVRRAIKEAKLPAGARFLKTTPLSMRDRTAEWMRIYDVEGGE